MKRYLVLLVGLCMPGLLSLPAMAQTGAGVRLQKMLNADTGQYRVEGAVGRTEQAAMAKAKYAALDFAARSLTGDPGQKTVAAAYVKDNLKQLIGFATSGKIFRRDFDDSGENISLHMLVNINNQALQRHLVEANVITSSKDISKSAGKPEIMVFYAQGDCAKGKATAPICVLPKRIKEAARAVTKIENGIIKFQQALIKSGCLIATERSVDHSRSSTDKSGRSGSHEGQSASRHDSSGRSSASGSASRFHADGRRRSSGSSSSGHRSSSSGRVRVQLNRESTATFSAKSIKASSNCKTFMNTVGAKVASLRAAMRKRNALQDELDEARKGMAANDVTTIRVNEWFVNQRWEVMDVSAVRKAQRSLDAMSTVAGLPADPVAAVALMAGADVYIEHDLVEERPNGGYRATVTLKAYEVVSGKLLASKVGKSNVLMSPDKQAGVEKAVGRAMGKILEQITGYWSDMAKEGVKTKIVIRGDFSNSDVSDTIDDLLDETLADEIGRRCQGQCEWEGKMSTQGTIMGNYVGPVKARKRVGKKLRRLLKSEGFGVSKIVDKPTLQIIEIIQ